MTWKAGEDPAVAGRPAPPPRYRGAQSTSHLEKIADQLYPGALLACERELYVDTYHTNLPHPLLVTSDPAWAQAAPTVAHRGDLVIYAGTVRYEEETSKSSLRVVRHTVICRGQRYILSTLDGVKPVDD